MGRLKIVLLLAAMAATAQTASGQSQAVNAEKPAGPSPTATYVVMGDVQNCDYYSLNAPAATTIREAVVGAGLLNESSSVAVLRGTQEQAVWTQMISPGGADSGEKVLPGDVLVVQSLQPLKAKLRQNAALRTDAGVLLVALADEAIAVGDVLQQTGNLSSAPQNIRISFRFSGRTPTVNAALTDRVYHGDVIAISQASRRTLKGFGKMSPAFSEWSGSDDAVSQLIPPPATTADKQLPDTPTQAPLHLPGLFDQHLTQPAEPVSPSEAANELIPSDTLTSGKPSGISVQPISQAVPASPVDAVELVAPVPPVEVPLADVPRLEQQASGLGFWNLVLVGVLLVAGILTLVGSLKPDDENSIKLAETAEQGRGAIPSLTLFHGPPVPAAETELPSSSVAVAETQTVATRSLPSFTATQATVGTEPVSRNAPLQSSRTSPAGLVASEEWLSGEWRNRSSIPAAPINALPETRVMPSISELSAHEEPPVSQHSSDNFDNSRASSLAVPLRPIVAQDFANVPQLAAKPPQVSMPVVSPVASKSKTLLQSETPGTSLSPGLPDDLDELLQNRLPIDLCAAQLPVRVALFGKAAGPRRLRIDAAHSRVPAPHFHANVERKKEEPAMTAASERVVEHRTATEAGSLDRALYNLQNRIDS